MEYKGPLKLKPRSSSLAIWGRCTDNSECIDCPCSEQYSFEECPYSQDSFQSKEENISSNVVQIDFKKRKKV